jgi:hypothetical protein
VAGCCGSSNEFSGYITGVEFLNRSSFLKNDSCPGVSNPRRLLRSVSLSFSLEISFLAELIFMKNNSVIVL